MGLLDTVQQMSADLVALLKSTGASVSNDLGVAVNPPQVIVGPPALEWAGFSLNPTAAEWTVYIVVKADDQSIPRLMQLAGPVIEALSSQSGTVIKAEPGTWSAGGTALPAYVITYQSPTA